MRKLALAVLLVATPVLAAKPKPAVNPADYTLPVQVNCSFVTHQYNGTFYIDVVHLGVTLNGKQLELATPFQDGSLPFTPGTYKARLLKDSSPNAYEIQQTYELLLPDGKTRSFSVFGIGRAVCGVPAP